MQLFKPNFVYVLIRGFFRRFFRIWGSWNIVGHDHIPKEGPVIIISNHSSYLDPPMMGSAVKRPVAYMAKAELFTGNRLLKWVCEKLESYPVKIGTVDREALKHTFQRLDNGWMVGIFPEGHRSETGKLQEFQTGFAMIALKSRAPVIPCGFSGSYEMMPPHSKSIRRSHIEVHFGPALQLDDLYDAEDRRAAMEEATARAYRSVADLVEKASEARNQWNRARGHQESVKPS